MQLPVDVKALIDEMTNIDSARATELSVSVYVDDAAPADLAAHVRGLFASVSSSVRMTISYLDNTFSPHVGDDIAVIVAGASRKVGAAAAAVRAAGVPVAVVTVQPARVNAVAAENGHAIPEGDVIAPDGRDGAGIAGAPGASEEPPALTDERAAELDERLGRWIVAVCHDKRLAFAIAFPFMRRPLAVDAVQATSLQNAGVGLVPLIPGADLPIMTLNQGKMVLQIAAAYGQDMSKERAKELAAVVGGAYLCRTLARELVEFVPVLGFAVRTGIAYGGTAAIGHAVIEYFEGGQDAPGVANVASSAAKAASKLAATVRDNPEELVNRARAKVEQAVPVVRDKVGTYVPAARDLAYEYGPKARAAVAEYAPAVKQAATDALRSWTGSK